MRKFVFALALAALLQMPAPQAFAQGGGGLTLSPPQRGYCFRDRMTRETVCGFAGLAECRKAVKSRQADCLLAAHIEGGKDLLHGR